jgi:predicted RNA-binding protein with TRAM domain
MNERFERHSRFGQRDRQQFSPPVRVDEEIDVKIEAVGEKGDGVAKKDGFVLFVPNVKEGDYVRVKVTKVLRKVGFAEVVGDAKTPEPEEKREPTEEVRREKQEEKEEEFQPSEDDSEDFGEDGDEEVKTETTETEDVDVKEELEPEEDDTKKEHAEEPEEDEDEPEDAEVDDEDKK